MKYDRDKHHRRSTRLKQYYYSREGAYFITICTDNRICLLSEIKEGCVELSKTGEIVQKCWMETKEHFKNIKMDVYVIMPNHVHGIIFIEDKMVLKNGLKLTNGMGSNDIDKGLMGDKDLVNNKGLVNGRGLIHQTLVI